VSKIEEIYDRLATELFVKKANEKLISPYIRKAFIKCQSYLDPNITFEQFAAWTANFFPGRAGIGEESQIEFLKTKFPSIKKLPVRGKKSLKLFRGTDGGLFIKRSATKSNINGIKSFDAISISDNKIYIFMLKTIDIGSFSESVGGGQQDNAENEIINILDVIGASSFSFEDKNVEIIIGIDGRSAGNKIAYLKEKFPNLSNVTITMCEDL